MYNIEGALETYISGSIQTPWASYSLYCQPFFLLFACEHCDDSPASPNDANSALIATFKISSVLVPEAVDVNGDGISSHDLLDESDCFEPSFLTFNRDGTFRHRIAGIKIVDGTHECEARTVAGNWSREGNTITAVPFSAGESITFAFDPNTSEIKMVRMAEYPRIQDQSGNLETAQGDVTTIFEVN